ncbi:MAG: hypothetical protein DRQ89_14340 [Epsilonproteobacteria bacterium]|nr:MAG: hypothetical protein DRQ89_14340 [Campylobacterota bacterium]
MAEPIISFIPENDKEFKAALEKMGESISDFRIPFQVIGNHWYKGNRKIFALKSGGLYPPLGGFNNIEKVKYRGAVMTKNKRAELIKAEQVGFVFPILRGATKRLEGSLVSKNGAGAVFFAGRKTMVMGTDIDYAKYHQSDRPRKTLPQRKVIFIDGGPAEIAKDAVVSGRIQAWTKIIEDYVAQVITGDASA